MKGTRKLTLTLWRIYSPAELEDKAQQLSATIKDCEEVELQKAAATKEFNEELKSLRSQFSVLAKEIRERGAYKHIECEVEYHEPRVGMKTITRLDTGAIVREEPMTDEEKQENLFAEAEGA